MRDREIESIVGWKERRPIPLYTLMPHRVRNILLVSSLYDFYTFEEDGRLTEVLFSEYLELNLRYAPRIQRVSTAAEALERLRRENFDLVISMLRVGGMDVIDFGKAVKDVVSDMPVVLLAYHTRELQKLETIGPESGIDRVFVWLGDVRIFLAIIKYIEDRMNATHDAEVAGVKSIILIEDSIHFYSTYLPMLFSEVVKQTQSLMADGVNRLQKLIRMRARPKILLANSYEEGLDLYNRYQDNLLGVIIDAEFPRNGRNDKTAGLDFATMLKEDPQNPPVLMQSSNAEHEEYARAIGARFINKFSPTLLTDVGDFIREDLGFGDFVFRMPDGAPIISVSDMNAFREALEQIPEESLLYHAGRNDFSTWLMARTEFDLARDLRPRTIEEFEDAKAIRKFILGALSRHMAIERGGLIAEFSTETYDAVSTFLRIGSGSLGGKGRGLAFVNSLLSSYQIDEHIPGAHIFVPTSSVIATDIFDMFMASSNLLDFALNETDDMKICREFLKAEMPEEVRNLLEIFLKNVEYPLAVRSSSLLEDIAYQPFAGIYNTFMLPNNAPDTETRLQELCNAIKLVYASCFLAESRTYVDATPNRLEDVKMAVIIQELVGRIHENFLYPHLSGVARSYDHYPMEGMTNQDGVANVALGLGRTVVEGGKCVRFSPRYPRKMYQFSTIEDYLESSQRQFMALDMSKPGPDWDSKNSNTSNFATLDLDVAEKHGTLYATGSTYSPENDAVYDGISRPGVRMVTMSGILKGNAFPLPDILNFLLDVGEAGFSCPVEIEFAANLRKDKNSKHEFAFLQIRPLVVSSELREIDPDEIDRNDVICMTDMAIGFGFFSGVRDLVYVRQDKFDRGRTPDIVSQIEIINFKLKNMDGKRPYILIGPGRWGTADRYYGIPVNWAQISEVQCIVETDIRGIKVEPSQGTHFFHNMTSFGIGYFTVNQGAGNALLDSDWLDAQPAKFETEFVRWLSFDEPMEVVVGARKGIGVIMKPGITFK